jgi:atlastin
MSALTVVKVVNGKLELDEAQLEKILLHPKAKNNPVVVISIAGALRKGKSTMLNFIKRYLKHGGKGKWIGEEGQPLNDGFEWKQGNNAVTKGILMWSEPFDWTLSKKKVAVLLLDTQGAFEVGSSNTINSAIFALSTLISSVQIFNSMQMIDQNDFGFLALFSRYTSAISAASKHKEAFQKLILLIRDWQSPRDIKYGQATLDDYLAKSQQGAPSKEWKEIETEFTKSFHHISCYLMPHPGMRMVILEEDQPPYDGSIDKLEKKFIEYLEKFVEALLDSSVVKKIGGKEVTGEDLLLHFTAYYKVLDSGKVSTPESILRAVAEVGYLKALTEGIKSYKDAIKGYIQTHGFWTTKKGVEAEAKKAQVEARKKIEQDPSIEHEDLKKEKLKELDEGIKETYQENLEKASSISNRRQMAIVGAVALGVAAPFVAPAAALAATTAQAAIWGCGLGTAGAGVGIITSELTEKLLEDQINE